MSAPVYLLLGEEFFADEALQKIRAESGVDPLAEATFDASDDISAIMGALQTPSLLGGRRLVVVSGAGDLTKDQLEALRAYIESPSPDAVLVLVARGRSKLDDVVKRQGAVISLEAPRGRRLVGWVRERAAARKMRLDDRGAWALLDAVGSDPRDLDLALDQLSSAVGADRKVGSAEVRRLFPRLADERIYAFTDAVGDRKLAPAMSTLRRLLEQGEEPLVLFGALTAHVRRMLRARAVADGGAGAVGDALGLPGWRAERLHRQARSYREEELAAALQMLAAADLEMKGDLPSPEAVLEGTVARIVAGAAPPV